MQYSIYTLCTIIPHSKLKDRFDTLFWEGTNLCFGKKNMITTKKFYKLLGFLIDIIIVMFGERVPMLHYSPTYFR